MKLAYAMYILSGSADPKVQRMVNEVDTRAIYAELTRRGLVWSGHRWIKFRWIEGPQ